jgi:transaldolase
MSNYDQKIAEFLMKDINEVAVAPKKDPFWAALNGTGTNLWLDTGDMQEAESNWTAEMSALTTNNTLINNEIQKGIYDNFISDARSLVKGLPSDEQVKEIAFILNARHGLRLAAKFGGFVSVELHTDTANDLRQLSITGKDIISLIPNNL